MNGIITIVFAAIAGLLLSLTPLPYLPMIAFKKIRETYSEDGFWLTSLFLIFNWWALVLPVAFVFFVFSSKGWIAAAVFMVSLFHVYLRLLLEKLKW